MEPDFWHSRWQKNEIGFHKDGVNLYLQSYWEHLELELPARCPVLVPLCGKSNDLLWLNRQGHPVLGVEISPIAVEAFFRENGLEPEISKRDGIEHWRHGDIEIICGDLFALPRETFQEIGAVYDRASLVALPEGLRRRYAEFLSGALPDKVKILLVSLEYPQEQMDGPPFSVSDGEVRANYGGNFEITALASQDMLHDNPHLQQRGVTRLLEKVYKLSRG